MSAQERDTMIRKLMRGVSFLALVGTVCYCQIAGVSISEGFWGVIGMAMTFYFQAEKDDRTEG